MARAIDISTPLDKDVLLFHKMHATEELGRLSECDLHLLSENQTIDLNDVLGKMVTVSIRRPDDSLRYYNGYVTRISQVGRHGRYHAYRATVRPWLWLLTRTTNCRIFQKKNVPDIIKDVFGHHAGIVDVQFELTESYGEWEYCVQYRESDFDFVSRLMEHEGIYYFFRHDEGRHTLVLADSYNAHPAAVEEDIPFIPPGRAVRADKEHISEWSISRELQPGKYALTDYDFERPSVDLEVKSHIKREHALAEYEVYDYPGDYLMRNDGETYARTRIEELQAKHERVQGATNSRNIATGFLFRLVEHPREDQNTEYLAVFTELELQSSEYESIDATATPAAVYKCEFTALNSKQPFRAERLTRKPIVRGTQTAIVVGPAGEEIYTDKYGRIKVQFHWDRLGANNESSSCWIRVSTPWAGKQWGIISIPRIGQEVIVDFLEGDPDQPIAIGSVYNAEQMPAFGLPGKKMVSGVKSDTYHGGGYNEITLDDTAGTEKITIHGQYDMNTTVEHDQTTTVHNCRTDRVDVDDAESVGNNQSCDVGVDQSLSVGANRTKSVGANETISIGSNRDATVGASESLTVALQRTHTVGVNETITVGGAQEITIGGLQAVTIGAVQTIDVGASQSTSVGAKQSTSVGAARSITVGADQTTKVGGSGGMTIGGDESRSVGGGRTTGIGGDDSLSVGKSFSVTATDDISLTTGDASIAMKKDGTIVIKGKDITIEGSGQITVKASKDVVVKGSKVHHN
jgi:type VI secretion system secreted protein VgrG